MYFCYIDEAGCTGSLPGCVTDIQPIFVLCGLIVPAGAIVPLTRDFLSLKRKFNPAIAKALTHNLDIVKYEIKGAEDLRKPVRGKNNNKKRRAIGFLDRVFDLLDAHDCRILPNVYVKCPGKTIEGIPLYTRFIQRISGNFQEFLRANDDKGMVIADGRNYALNVRVSHSIFTQKYKYGGDPYPNIMEMPVYGHSDNHVAIQIADILCSAVLFPVASYVYCTGHITSVHVDGSYQILQARYAHKIKELCFRYHDGDRYRAGIVVEDSIKKRNASLFFRLGQ